MVIIRHCRTGVTALTVAALVAMALAANPRITLADAFAHDKGAARANVMLLLDTSATMDEAICHPEYDANTNWSGDFDPIANYQVTLASMRTPRSFNRNWPNTPSARLFASAGGHAAIFRGNYLNWVYYHATLAQREGIPQWTRIQMTQSVLSQVVAENPGLDFGLMIFNGNDGGRIVAKCGSSPLTVFTAISGTSADAGAPFAEAVEDVIDYFGHWLDPITEPQQRNFCLIVAGGLPTMDLAVSAYLQDADGDGTDPGTCTSLGAPYPDSWDCSGFLDDVTWYLAHQDLRPDLDGPQTVSTYVVGLAIDHPLLANAAANGNGLYFPAPAIGDFNVAVESAMSDIQRRVAMATPAPELVLQAAKLYPCRPNPFNPRTALRFDLPDDGSVRLAVFDLGGRLVRVLADADLDAGVHDVVWDGRDEAGRDVGSGSYLARLEFDGKAEIVRMGLVR